MDPIIGINSKKNYGQLPNSCSKWTNPIQLPTVTSQGKGNRIPGNRDYGIVNLETPDSS